MVHIKLIADGLSLEGEAKHPILKVQAQLSSGLGYDGPRTYEFQVEPAQLMKLSEEILLTLAVPQADPSLSDLDRMLTLQRKATEALMVVIRLKKEHSS